MLDYIIEKTADYRPAVVREPCEAYPSLKQGDVVLDFNEDLALVYEGGRFQITYGEWIGDYKNPLPVLLTILEGYAVADGRSLVVVDDGESREVSGGYSQSKCKREQG